LISENEKDIIVFNKR